MPQHHPAPIFEPFLVMYFLYPLDHSNQIRSAPRYQSSFVMGHPPGFQGFCYIAMPKIISLRFPLASPISPSTITEPAMSPWKCGAGTLPPAENKGGPATLEADLLLVGGFNPSEKH